MDPQRQWAPRFTPFHKKADQEVRPTEAVVPLLGEALTVLGCAPGGAAIQDQGGSLVVYDATGRAAMMRSAANKMGPDHRRMV